MRGPTPGTQQIAAIIASLIRAPSVLAHARIGFLRGWDEESQGWYLMGVLACPHPKIELGPQVFGMIVYADGRYTDVSEARESEAGELAGGIGWKPPEATVVVDRIGEVRGLT